VNLPEAYAPAGIPLRVIGAQKPHIHDKAQASKRATAANLAPKILQISFTIFTMFRLAFFCQYSAAQKLLKNVHQTCY
jgi:hypothetical protein